MSDHTPCPACNNTGWMLHSLGVPYIVPCTHCDGVAVVNVTTNVPHGLGVLRDETPPPDDFAKYLTGKTIARTLLENDGGNLVLWFTDGTKVGIDAEVGAGEAYLTVGEMENDQ